MTNILRDIHGSTHANAAATAGTLLGSSTLTVTTAVNVIDRIKLSENEPETDTEDSNYDRT